MTSRDDTPEPIAALIARWEGTTGKEIADFQPFMRQLYAALGPPDPRAADATSHSREDLAALRRHPADPGKKKPHLAVRQ